MSTTSKLCLPPGVQAPPPAAAGISWSRRRLPSNRPEERSRVLASQRRRGWRPTVGQTAGSCGQRVGAESISGGKGVYWIHANVQKLNWNVCHRRLPELQVLPLLLWILGLFCVVLIMKFISWTTLHPPQPVGGEESVQTDEGRMNKCVKIVLNSYGIVVALVPSLYNSLFKKKNSS